MVLKARLDLLVLLAQELIPGQLERWPSTLVHRLLVTPCSRKVPMSSKCTTAQISKRFVFTVLAQTRAIIVSPG